MRPSLKPPHTERGYIQDWGNEAGEKHDPSSRQAEGFTIVEGKKPGHNGFALRESSPILYAEYRSAILIDPYLTLALGLAYFTGLAQSHREHIVRTGRKSNPHDLGIGKGALSVGDRLCDREPVCSCRKGGTRFTLRLHLTDCGEDLYQRRDQTGEGKVEAGAGENEENRSTGDATELVELVVAANAA